MNEKMDVYINGGREFIMHFTDGTKANFGICEDCLKNLTMAQSEEILKRQLVNWGLEIQGQLSWFIKEAVHLRVDKWI
jgi:hypothetical protein